MTITTVEVDTRANKDSEVITTNLSINWEGMSNDDLIALAQQTIVIKLQGAWRKNGIPTELKVNATEHKVGVRAPRSPQSLDSLLAKLTPEQRAELAAKLLG